MCFLSFSPAGAENLSSLVEGLRTIQSTADKCMCIGLILSKEAPLAKTALLPEKQLVQLIYFACGFFL